jgi:pyrroline-5-carboxylate reductase
MNLQTTPRRCALGFIGGGKLAGSVIRGLLRARYCAAGKIIAGEPNPEIREKLTAETGIATTDDNRKVAGSADVLLIGVKPAMVLSVIKEIASEIDGRLVVSLAAGVRLTNMESAAPGRFMRAMTNTPTTVCRGATALARGQRTTNDDLTTARKIFNAIGETVEVMEDQIDAVTALAGSGPAFVYTVIDALAEGGKRCGLPAEAAMTLATQTVLGAAQLAAESRKTPEELIKMVVTPGGTTAAGLAEMEKLGTTRGLIAAVEAATKRGREMAEEHR